MRIIKIKNVTEFYNLQNSDKIIASYRLDELLDEFRLEETSVFLLTYFNCEIVEIKREYTKANRVFFLVKSTFKHKKKAIR